MAGLDRVADVVCSGVIPAGELWEVYIDRVGEGESPPFHRLVLAELKLDCDLQAWCRVL